MSHDWLIGWLRENGEIRCANEMLLTLVEHGMRLSVGIKKKDRITESIFQDESNPDANMKEENPFQ